MARYRSTPDGWLNLDTGETQSNDGWRERAPSLPRVVNDLQPYACPITGKMITSRSEHRDNLAKHGMRVMEPDESPTGGKIRNAAFAKKRGLTVSEEFRDYDSTIARTKKETAA